MKKTLYDYQAAIRKLPMKDKYTKDELLTIDFIVEKEGNVAIYYAPHNEHINPHAKVFIVGITPGFEQMSTAIATARKLLEDHTEIAQVQHACKVAARFSGSLRKNMIEMLDELQLPEALGIASASELFGHQDALLHTVSLVPYSVFVKGSNYSGHSPKLIKSEFLMKYVYDNFIEELKKLHDTKNLLLIPLGKAVEEVLLQLENEGIIEKNLILRGFPHPSGANANRHIQFAENKVAMMKLIREKLIN